MYPNLNHKYVSFKQANVNIMAFSDIHGELKNIPALYQNLCDNKNDIFQNKEDKSTLNVMALVGDWFMNPSNTGYLTSSNKTSGDFQELFLKTFIGGAKKLIPGLKTIYTPGNHCFDAGDKVFKKHIKNIEMDTIVSNVDFVNSDLTKGLTKKQKQRINECKVLQVQDDKNPKLKHKVLVVGLLPINIDFLVKEDIKGLKALGTNNKKDADLNDLDAEEASNILSDIVCKFKEENPTSAVLLMSHCGENVSTSVAKKVGNIDVILNAHDHLDKLSYVPCKNGTVTKIVSLSQNAHKLEAVKLHFDDNGSLSVKTKPYYTDFAKKLQNNPMQKMFTKVFEKDLLPLVKIQDPKGRDSLTIDDIRYSNNDLANFCTDAIFSQLKPKYPDLKAFILPSTAFRANIPTSQNRDVLNLDVVELFKGISGNLSNIMVGEMRGKDLATYIYSNVVENLASPSRNAINQYSGIMIDRTAISEAQEEGINLSSEDICSFIKIKNEEGEYENIDLDKNYAIALPKKIFVKTQEKYFKKYENVFFNTDKKVNEYFNDFLNNSSEDIVISSDKRIV